jgi:predicted amidophosphoribosyltransferase
MNTSDSSYYLVDYQPYRIHGEKNPEFDKTSGLIMDLKDGKSSGIKWAFDLVNPFLGKNFSITVVPSHDSEKIDSPIKEVAKLLTKAGPNRIDATYCLVRHKTISKLAHGGTRSFHVHLESIRVVNQNLIKGRQVLVFDDVQTSGNSLLACAKLLENAGAAIVKTLSIAKTL